MMHLDAASTGCRGFALPTHLAQRQIPGLEQFVEQLSTLSGDPELARLDTPAAKLSLMGQFFGLPSKRGQFEIYRSVAYSQHVNTILADEGSMSRDEYDHHYRGLLVARFNELLESRARQIDDAIAAVCAAWQVEYRRWREEKRQRDEAAEAAPAASEGE